MTCGGNLAIDVYAGLSLTLESYQIISLQYLTGSLVSLQFVQLGISTFPAQGNVIAKTAMSASVALASAPMLNVKKVGS